MDLGGFIMKFDGINSLFRKSSLGLIKMKNRANKGQIRI